MRRLSRHIFPGLICGVIILILCGLPGSYFPTTRIYWEYLQPDKLVHGFMFAVLAFSIIWGYRDEYCEKDKSHRIVLQIVTFLVSAFYGGLIEILQKYLFPRTCDMYDFLADIIGCVLGICIFKLAFRKKIIKKTSTIQ